MLAGHKSILTTDQDLYQAISEDVDVISPTKEMTITNEGFEKMVGVPRSAYLVYKAMVGDSSDGIPGIKGVGEKTAAKLIYQYGGNRSDILRAAEVDLDMPTHLREKIKGYGKEGFFHAMMTMRLDMDLCGARHALLKAFNAWESYDHSQCKQFLQMYALVSLMEPSFYNAFRRLSDPKTILSDISKLRLPVVTKLPRCSVG
jgi:5'-3' exonuclease